MNVLLAGAGADAGAMALLVYLLQVCKCVTSTAFSLVAAAVARFTRCQLLVGACVTTHMIAGAPAVHAATWRHCLLMQKHQGQP
jgi:hypothetical protein